MVVCRSAIPIYTAFLQSEFLTYQHSNMENDKISNTSVEDGTFIDLFQIYLTSPSPQTAKTMIKLTPRHKNPNLSHLLKFILLPILFT